MCLVNVSYKTISLIKHNLVAYWLKVLCGVSCHVYCMRLKTPQGTLLNECNSCYIILPSLWWRPRFKKSSQLQLWFLRVCTSAWSTVTVWFTLDCLLRTDSAEWSGRHLAVSHSRPIRARGRQQLGRGLIHRNGPEHSCWEKRKGRSSNVADNTRMHWLSVLLNNKAAVLRATRSTSATSKPLSSLTHTACFLKVAINSSDLMQFLVLWCFWFEGDSVLERWVQVKLMPESPKLIRMPMKRNVTFVAKSKRKQFKFWLTFSNRKYNSDIFFSLQVYIQYISLAIKQHKHSTTCVISLSHMNHSHHTWRKHKLDQDIKIYTLLHTIITFST